MNKRFVILAAMLAGATPCLPAAAQLSIKQQRAGIPAGGGTYGVEGIFENDSATETLFITTATLSGLPVHAFLTQFPLRDDAESGPLELGPGEELVYDGEPDFLGPVIALISDTALPPGTYVPGYGYPLQLELFGYTNISPTVLSLGVFTIEAQVPGATVPEPGSMALLGSALLAGGLLRNRRRRR